MAPELPADEPKTDREWLMMIAKDIKAINKKLDGKDGLCDIQKKQQEDIDELKKWRIYQAVMLIALIILIAGRYIFGPTSIPLVP
jgi:hypothetical protein